MASIYQPEQEEKNKDQQESTLTGGAAGGSNVQKTTASPAAPKPQGSGRFTNIQKYLQANKQGGQQLAQGVGQNIQSGISKQKEQSQDYLSNIRQGIESAKGVAQKGGQYLQQLKGIGENIQQATGAEQAVTRPQDLGIQQFTKQPGFQQFQDIQAGRGVDEALLGSQQADLSRAAGQYLSESQQAAQKLGTGGGRFDLLRQTFGGDVNPQYTTGQQRLDQLFLARQGLQPLQEDVRQNIKSARELSRQASQTGADVGRLIGQERQLMGDIGAQAKSNEQAYLDMLSSYVPEINRLRDQQYAQAEQAFKGAAGTSGASLSDEQLANLGLSRGQKIYDVLDDLSFQDVTQKGQRATGYQDIASEADVNRYQALARMAGITPESQALTSASDLGAAYVGKEGEQSLASRLAARVPQLEKEDKRALDKTVEGLRRSGYISDNFINRVQNIGTASALSESDDPAIKEVLQSVREDVAAGRAPQSVMGKGFVDLIKFLNRKKDLEGRTLQSPTDKRVAVGPKIGN